jgi:hypothetical protein
MMKRRIVEMIGKRNFAPRVVQMAEDMGLSYEEAKAWQARCESVTDSKADYLVHLLHDWWQDKLWDTSPLIIQDFKNARHIRIKILRDMLIDSPDGIQLNNAELSMILGCSDSNLSGIYESARVESQRMRQWVSHDKDFDLDKLVKDAEREHKGKALAIRIKYRDTDHEDKDVYTPLLFNQSEQYSALARHKNSILKLVIMVEQPSLIRLKTACAGFYMQLLWQFELLGMLNKVIDRYIDFCTVLVWFDIELGTTVDNTQGSDSESTADDGYELDAEEPIIKPVRNSPQSTKRDRDWTRFDPQFIWKQLHLEAHIFTLEGLIPDDLTQIQAVKWIGERAKDKPIRTVDSYFKQQEMDSTLDDLARFLGGKKREGLAANSRQKDKALETRPTPQETLVINSDDSNPYARTTIEYPKPSERAIEQMKQSFRDGHRFGKGA